MPEPVSPDRPIWPPLPAETDRRSEGMSDSRERLPPDAEPPEPAGDRDGVGTSAGRAMPTRPAISA